MSWQVHLEFLKLKSKEVIESAAELEHVVNAVHEIKKSTMQFKSAWGLSQIVLSILCQSCKAVPVDHSEIDLFLLLDLGIRMCPVDTAPFLAAMIQDGRSEEKTPSDIAALVSAIVADIAKQEESSVAKNTLFHFLLTWEYLLKQRKVSVSTFMHCATFVGMCLGELHACRSPDSEKEEECIKKLCSQWLANLIAYGSLSFSYAKATISFIADQLLVSRRDSVSESAPTSVRVALQNSFGSPLAPRHWVSLVHCFLDGAYKMFRRCAREEEEAAREGEQALAIKDHLTRMVSQEPPVLSEQFDAPLNIVEVETTAHTLEEFCRGTSRCIAATLELLDHVLLAVDLSHVISLVTSNNEYSHCLQNAPLYNYTHTIVSVALREGHVETALTLLEKTVGDALPSHRQWVHRLRRWVKQEPLCEAQKMWFGEASAVLHAPAPHFSVFARGAAQQLDVEGALDILVGPSRMELLRLVCHTILHEPTCAWVPQLLRDPYAPFFIHEALVRLTRHLIAVTDLPLARHYMASLILCAAHHTTRCSVRQVLRVTYEFALALRGTSSPTTASFWERIEKCFSNVQAEEEAMPTRQSAALGKAFDTRDSFFRFFRDSAVRGSTDLQYERPYTLVQIHILDSGSICLKRRRYNDCFSTLESNVEVPIASVGDFNQALDHIRNIAQINKRQLSAGVDAFNALQERSATQRNTSSSGDGTTPSKRAEKEKWWKRRFDLDMELRHEIQQLELSLGVSRLLLLGELDLPLRLQLRAVSEQLASAVTQARKPEMESINQDKLLSFIFLLLQGLPYLYHTPHECEVKVSSRVRYARKHLLYNPQHADCTLCNEAKQRLSALLCLVIENFVSEKGPQPLSPIAVTVTDKKADTHDLYSNAVSACLEAFYTSLDSIDSESMQEHKNLRAYPRQHLYLATHSALQSIPWEALDVAKGQYISRVPSEAYLETVAQQGGVSRGLGSVFLYGDTHHEATKMERFEPILQAHPQWSSSTDSPASAPESNISDDSSFLAQLLRDSISLYVFAGHKKGEQLISRAHLYDRFPTPPSQFPSVLLMGCGSAATRGGPQCDSYGMPLAYLHAGSPAFVGCLWDITDGEIDKLTCKFLASLEEYGSLAEALASSRCVCKLPYLSAAATVFYGVDVKFS